MKRKLSIIVAFCLLALFTFSSIANAGYGNEVPRMSAQGYLDQMLDSIRENQAKNQLYIPFAPGTKTLNSGLATISNIDGNFEDWDGDTEFILTNGQIWQQDSYDYIYHYAYSPKVLIYTSGSGWKMKVDGVGKDIYVKRLK